MKKIFIFIGLKVVEVGGAVFLWWLLCFIWKRIPFHQKTPFWFGGVPMIAFLAIAAFIGLVLYVGVESLIKRNLILTDKLAKRWSKQ